MGVDEDIDFEQPHGVQTEISGLRQWLGVSSWAEDHKWGPETVDLTVRSVRHPVIELGGVSGMELELRPGARVARQDENDRLVLVDYVRCVTLGSEPRSWSVHLGVHHAIRDLLMLSRWNTERCSVVKAQRDDDRQQSIDGTRRGIIWRDVIDPDDELAPTSSQRKRHLVEYTDLGVSGLQQWFALRDEFGRALGTAARIGDNRSA